jgi:antagonist of KipI
MGSVQVPADGQPIVLMADRQTLGGYPKIANVAMVDLPYLSQRPPGTSIMFAEIDLETSRNEWRLRQYMINQIRASL